MLALSNIFDWLIVCPRLSGWSCSLKLSTYISLYIGLEWNAEGEEAGGAYGGAESCTMWGDSGGKKKH